MNPAGGSGDLEGRDGWCTPGWLAELIGDVDLDPCSNERSHVRAAWRCVQNWGSDGLKERDGRGGFEWAHSPASYKPLTADVLTASARDGWRVFVNPPYGHGEVIRWVRHYAHTRFIFLLRWDPSTVWFSELIPACTHVWFPRRRINFEPPPGVKGSSNPFPHALYLRAPGTELLTRLAPAGYLVPLDRATTTMQGDAHVQHPPTCTRDRGTGEATLRQEGAAVGAAPGRAQPGTCHCIEGEACNHPVGAVDR